MKSDMISKVFAAIVAVIALIAVVLNVRPVREVRERTAYNMGRNGVSFRAALAAALQGVGKTSADALQVSVRDI